MVDPGHGRGAATLRARISPPANTHIICPLRPLIIVMDSTAYPLHDGLRSSLCPRCRRHPMDCTVRVLPHACSRARNRDGNGDELGP